MYSFLQLKLNSQDDVFLACAEPDPASERGRANGGFHIFKIFLLIDPKMINSRCAAFGLVVSDTPSDSIQCLNFVKNDSFNIRFNIALPKIQFKILLN